MKFKDIWTKEENGETKYLLEDVARACGIVQRHDGIEYVRWERVREILGKIGVVIEKRPKDVYIDGKSLSYLVHQAKNERAFWFRSEIPLKLLRWE